jgi:heme exporter protein CcmD
MNEHAFYIVLSYSIGALVLGWTALSPLLKKRRLLAQLKRLDESA